MFPLKDNLRCMTFPAVTLTLIVLNSLAFVLETIMISNSSAQEFLGNWALTPADLLAAFASGDPAAMLTGTVTLFTAMFLHGGIMHLVGNMVFLFVFGRAMEARLGRVQFLLFYLVSGVLASLAHIMSDPTSITPMLGASGAISGVLGGYLLLWPKAKIFSYVPPIFLVHITAWMYLLGWIGLQLYPVLMTESGSLGGIAYWAHIGGYVAGFVISGIVKLIQPESDVCYVPTACTPCDDDDDSEDKG